MKISKFSLLIIIILTKISYPQQYNLLLEKAFRNDESIFVNRYIANSFKLWLDRWDIKLSDTELDTINKSNEEILLHINSPKFKVPYHIFLTIQHDKKKKLIITDIRRDVKIAPELAIQINVELVKIIGRFAWKYDIGDKCILEDLFFSDVIQIEYNGQRDEIETVDIIKRDFPNIFPAIINSVDTVGQYVSINLGPHPKIRPIYFSIDQKRYLTEYFVNIQDKFIDLTDSLNIWKSVEQRELGDNSLTGNFQDPEKLIEYIIQNNFDSYESNIVKIDDYHVNLELSLKPFYEKFNSPILNYNLNFYHKQNNELTYKISLKPSKKNEENYLKYIDYIESDTLSSIAKEILEQNLYFYSTIHLQPGLRYKIKQDDETKVSIIINQKEVDILSDISVNAAVNILNRLAQDQIVYYFVQKYSVKTDLAEITGYLIFQNRKLHLHHFLKITEKYTIANNSYDRKNIQIEILPFIRTDNIKSMFGDS
ncbi:MAG: hypothetical protein GF353_05810 [Candidatus Lokiarchaeota archaeon]|nr:hypothetical protein [Candidatus Lokiarchaeota archaeon]